MGSPHKRNSPSPLNPIFFPGLLGPGFGGAPRGTERGNNTISSARIGNLWRVAHPYIFRVNPPGRRAGRPWGRGNRRRGLGGHYTNLLSLRGLGGQEIFYRCHKKHIARHTIRHLGSCLEGSQRNVLKERTKRREEALSPPSFLPPSPTRGECYHSRRQTPGL